MMPAYLRLQRTLAKVGPAVIETPERRKFNHDLTDSRTAEEVIIRHPRESWRIFERIS